MEEDIKVLTETAARARRLAFDFAGDRTGAALKRYAEEVEEEIRRRVAAAEH